MLGKTTNALLQKIEAAVEAKIDPKFAIGLKKTVSAGLMVMYSPQSHDMMVKQMQQPGEPTELAGEGTAKLMGLLYTESRQTMPMKVLFPAATVLLCEGLDFMEKSGKIQITNDTVSAAMTSLSSNLLQLLHISQDQLHSIINKGAASIQKPQAAPAAQRGGIINGAMQGAQP